MKAVYLFSIALFICSCLSTQKLVKTKNFNDYISHLSDTLKLFQASGDININVHDERYRGKIDIILNNESDFQCHLYSPFKQIGSFIANSDSIYIELENQNYKAKITDSLHNIPFFSVYPFSFTILIRILTGRILPKEYYSFVYGNRKKGRLFEYKWLSDSLEVTLMTTKNRKLVKKIQYRSLASESWNLDLSSFKNGTSRKIIFSRQNKTIFDLVLKKVKCIN